LAEDANLWPIDDICRELEQDFISGKLDEVYMIYTKFKSALSMTVTTEKLLPMDSGSSLLAEGQNTDTSASVSAGVTLFEPSVEGVFSQLIPRILRSRVRQAALDAKASEYGSRMTSMESATKNAGQLIKKLQLTYNKVRQSRITSELLDILGGSEATK
jgi:F-type H+-transporting ATPase subunit gamma